MLFWLLPITCRKCCYFIFCLLHAESVVLFCLLPITCRKCCFVLSFAYYVQKVLFCFVFGLLRAEIMLFYLLPIACRNSVVLFYLLPIACRNSVDLFYLLPIMCRKCCFIFCQLRAKIVLFCLFMHFKALEELTQLYSKIAFVHLEKKDCELFSPNLFFLGNITAQFHHDYSNREIASDINEKIIKACKGLHIIKPLPVSCPSKHSTRHSKCTYNLILIFIMYHIPHLIPQLILLPLLVIGIR